MEVTESRDRTCAVRLSPVDPMRQNAAHFQFKGSPPRARIPGTPDERGSTVRNADAREPQGRPGCRSAVDDVGRGAALQAGDQIPERNADHVHVDGLHETRARRVAGLEWRDSDLLLFDRASQDEPQPQQAKPQHDQRAGFGNRRRSVRRQLDTGQDRADVVSPRIRKAQDAPCR